MAARVSDEVFPASAALAEVEAGLAEDLGGLVGTFRLEKGAHAPPAPRPATAAPARRPALGRGPSA